MIIGERSVFAIESEITEAFKKESRRGLGFLVILGMGRRSGVKSADATLLAVSSDEVGRRLSGRGKHEASFSEADAATIANAYTTAVYLDHDQSETYFGLSEASFTQTIYSSQLVWAPDGDEAFDDNSYVLQFDIWQPGSNSCSYALRRVCRSPPLQDLCLAADSFYDILRRWRQEFLTEWESLPKGS